MSIWSPPPPPLASDPALSADWTAFGTGLEDAGGSSWLTRHAMDRDGFAAMLRDWERFIAAAVAANPSLAAAD